MNRRDFFTCSALALGSFGLQVYSVPSFAKVNGKGKLIVVFLRGAADVLSMFPIRHAGAQDKHPLIQFRGSSENHKKQFLLSGLAYSNHHVNFHPSFEVLEKVIKTNNLAVITHTGSMHESRSHFEQMDFIESGSMTAKTTDGYLARATKSGKIKKKGLAVGTILPYSLRGGEAPLVSNLSDLKGKIFIKDVVKSDATSRERLENFKLTETCAVGSICETVSKAQDRFQFLSEEYSDEKKLTGSRFLIDCNIAASLSKNKDKNESAGDLITIDFGGWDTHSGQNPADPASYYSRNIKALAEGLEYLYSNVSPETTIVVMSEFGRTVAANPNMGTDHGRGSAMLVMGKNVNAKSIYASTSAKSKKLLGWTIPTYNQGNASSSALAVHVDWRAVMADLLGGHVGVDLANVFHGPVTKAGIIT